MLRVYELMIIIDSDVADVDSVISHVAGLVADEGATIKSTDNWGRRKFAYKINHKTEGTYVVWEIVTSTAGLPATERRLRLADEIVRPQTVPASRRRGRAPRSARGGQAGCCRLISGGSSWDSTTL